jgi:hypothetical protein
MKPTYQQVEMLVPAYEGLGATFNKVIQSGGNETVEPVPYRFGSKSKQVRQAAAHNLRLLRPLNDEFIDQKNAALMEVTDGKGHIEKYEGELNAKYAMKVRELQRLQVKEDIALEYIAEEDLNLDQNPIPPGIIATLALIPKPAPKSDA